jgi:pimeloyl-ACP methyl ester carboxylesterase
VSTATPIVFLHGLTFDRRMWDPVLDELPDGSRALALDLPGHGGSPLLAERGLEPVVGALHAAILDAGLDRPVVVGHSIGGPLAVSIDAPIRLEPFAALLHSIRPQLTGDGFDDVWAGFRQSMRIDQVPAAHRDLLRVGERASQEVVLSYQADLLERPLDEVVRWREAGLRRLREQGTPYVVLQARPVEEAERAWLLEHVPQVEIVVWPVGHHFPHLAEPARLAALVAGIAARA